MANSRGGMNIYIGGGVSNALLKGLQALRSQLNSFSSDAADAARTNVDSKIETVASKIQSATDAISSTSQASIKDVSSLLSEISQAANEASDELSQSGTETGKVFSSITDNIERTTKEFQKLLSGAKETSSELSGMDELDLIGDDDVEHAKVFIDVLRKLKTHLDGTLEGEQEAFRRAKDVTSQIVKLSRRLNELGMGDNEFNEYWTKDWAEGIDGVSVAYAELQGHIKRTRDGYEPLTEQGREVLNLSREQAQSLERVGVEASKYSKRLESLRNKQREGIEAAHEQKVALEILGDFFGKEDHQFDSYIKDFDNVNKAISRLQTEASSMGRIDIAEKLEGTDRAQVVLDSLNNKIKVTSKSLNVLSSESLSAFGDVTEEEARSIGILNEELSKFDRKMEELHSAHSEGVEGAQEHARALSKLGTKFGDSDADLKKYEKSLDDIAQAIGGLKTKAQAMGRTDIADSLGNVDMAEATLSKLRGEIETTNGTFKRFSDEGLDVFKKQLGEEGVQQLGLASQQLSKYEKKLNSLYEAFERGDASKAQTIEALERLEAQYGSGEKEAERFTKTVNDVEKSLTALKMRALDESREDLAEFVDGMDRAELAMAASRKEIKLTKDGFQALNEQGMQQLKGIAYEDADAFDMLAKQMRQAVKSIDPWEEKLESLRKENTEVARAMEHLGDNYGRDEKRLSSYRSAIRRAEKNLGAYESAVRDNIHALQEQIKKRREAGKSTTRHERQLEKLNSELKECTSSTRLMNESMEEYRERIHYGYKNTSRFAKGAQGFYRVMGPVASIMGAVNRRVKQFAAFVVAALIVRQLTIAIREFIRVISGFDQALYSLQAILDISADKAAVLGDTIKDVARSTKFSAAEVADGVQTLGQAGFSLQESMQSIQAISDLATGTMENFKSVVDLATSAIRAFQLDAVEATRVADVFANAINNSKLKIDKLATAFNYVGAAGHQAGLNLHELTGTLMTLADNGLRASTMGTGLRRMMLKMIDPTADLRSELHRYGMVVEDLNPKNVGWQKALQNLIPLLWDFEKQTVDMGKATHYFGTRASQVAAVLVQNSAENGPISKAIEKTKELGSAADMAALQQEGLSLKLKNLADRAKNVAIALGEAGITGAIKNIVDVLRAAAVATEDFLKTFPVVPQLLATATAMFTISSAIAGIRMAAIKAAPMIARFWTLLTGPVGMATAALTGLAVVMYQTDSAMRKASDAAAKFAEEETAAANAARSWGESLASSMEESRDEYEDSVERFKSANSKLAKSFEEYTGEVLESYSSVEKLSKAMRDFASHRMQEGVDSMVESIKNLNVQLQYTAKSYNLLFSSDFSLFNTDVSEKDNELLEKKEERVNSLANSLVKLAKMSGAETDSDFNSYLNDFFEESGFSEKDAKKIREVALGIVDAISEAAEKARVQLEKKVGKLSEGIQNRISELSFVDRFKLTGELESIEDNLRDYHKWLIENTDKTEKEITSLVRAERNARVQEYLDSLKETTASNESKKLAKQFSAQLDISLAQRLSKVKEGSVEELRIEKENIASRIAMYKDLAEKADTYEERQQMLKKASEQQEKYEEKERDLTDKTAENFIERSEEIIQQVELEADKKIAAIEHAETVGKKTVEEAAKEKAQIEVNQQERVLEQREAVTQKMLSLYSKESDEYKQAKYEQEQALLALGSAEDKRYTAALSKTKALIDAEEQLVNARKNAASAANQRSDHSQAYMQDGELAFRQTQSMLQHLNERKAIQEQYTDEMLALYDKKLAWAKKKYDEESVEFRKLEHEKTTFTRQQAAERKAIIDELTRESIAQNGSVWEQMKLGLQNYKDTLKSDGEKIVEGTQHIANSIQDSLGNALSDVIMGTKNASEAFKDFGRNILKEMSDMLASSVVRNFAGMLLGGISGGAGGGGGLFGSLLGNAKGNAFNDGKVMEKFEKGGVVNSPTVFPMKNGTGLMGEDGPEAIMPLSRNSKGELGVNSTGSQHLDLEVNVINKTGTEANARKSEPTFDGRKWVMNVILDAANRNEGKFGKNLKGALGKY